MKIAIVYSTFYVKGGAENVIVWLTAELLRRGHQVTIFTSEYDHQDPDIPAAVKRCMVEISAGGNYSTWLDWKRAGRRLRKRLQAFDIVNPHNFPANVWVYFARRRSRSFPPVICYCQEPSRLLYRQGQRRSAAPGPKRSAEQRLLAKIRRDRRKIFAKLLQKARYRLLMLFFRRALLDAHRALDRKAGAACDLILGNSDYMTAQIRRIYDGKGTTCRLGVPMSGLDAPATGISPRSEGKAEKKNYFLTVSRLESLKHVEEIIQALHVLVHREHEADAALVIVGQGSQEQVLRELVQDLELEARVVFAGHVPDRELAGYYREALAVVYVPEDEAFGLVPLEAMRQQTAVIVTREGGMTETVADGVTGLHVEPRQVDRLAAAMLTLLRDRARATAMGQEGRRHVLAHFTFSHFVDRFEWHLEQACELKPGT
jgi:glycosyltransferase involved in cell wall biosynthesis